MKHQRRISLAGSLQVLRARSVGRMSLYNNYPAQASCILCKAGRDLVEVLRGHVFKISAQDLLKGSLGKICAQDLWAGS